MNEKKETNPYDPRIGAVVRLKLGGPKMTVTASSPGHVQCTWFKDVELTRQCFASDELVEVKDGE